MTLPDLVLSADWLIDGTGAAPRRRPRLTVRAGRIHAVAADVPGGVAFPGCTILPGLIDTHVHLAFDAGPTHAAVVAGLRGLDEPALTARALANGQKALRAGVTTVRDCGSPFWVGQIVRDAVRRGHVAGPDVVACGSPITTAGGHLHYLGTLAATAAEVRVAAERLLDGPARVDALKVIATGGNMTPGSDRLACQYDEAALRAAVEVGRRHGAATAAHVLCRAAIGPCSAAGVRTLEHCLWRVGPGPGDFAFDPELARQLVDRGQYAGFTMSAPTWRKVVPALAGLDPELMGDLDARFAAERRTIGAGVRYLIHTDAGVRQTPFGPALALGVMAAVRELGLTPGEALRAVTATAAEALGLADRGRLLPGLRADVIVVEGNPLTDPAALLRVRAVVQAGRWVAGDLHPPHPLPPS